jgi:hypothetical protein
VEALALLSLALSLAALSAPRAKAMELLGATDPYQEWADQSLIPTPPSAIVVEDSPEGAHVIPPRTIHFYLGEVVRAEDPTLRALFLHEVGHVADFTMLRPKLRRAFARLFRFRPAFWYDVFGERFAMAYAFCALGVPDPPTDYFWGYGYSPPAWRHKRACALMQRLDG